MVSPDTSAARVASQPRPCARSIRPALWGQPGCLPAPAGRAPGLPCAMVPRFNARYRGTAVLTRHTGILNYKSASNIATVAGFIQHRGRRTISLSIHFHPEAAGRRLCGFFICCACQALPNSPQRLALRHAPGFNARMPKVNRQHRCDSF